MPNQNDEISDALNVFDLERARILLRDALKQPSAETYYLASLAALTENQRLDFLKKALDLDPFHAEALAALEASGQKESGHNSVEVVPTKPVSPAEQIRQGENASDADMVFVTGIVAGEDRVALYQIPSIAGMIRTQMPADSQVVVLTRDENVGWYNVVFSASTGQQILGWVETKFINSLNILGNPVEALDLPLTQFEWNSREDIDTLIGVKTEKLPSVAGLGLSIIGGSLIGLIALGILMSEEAGAAAGLILVFLGGGLVIYGINGFTVRSNLKNSPVADEIRQLQQVKQSKKPDSQRLMENQLIMAAMQTAVNVGSTLIAKIVPDRQSITIRNR